MIIDTAYLSSRLDRGFLPSSQP